MPVLSVFHGIRKTFLLAPARIPKKVRVPAWSACKTEGMTKIKDILEAKMAVRYLHKLFFVRMKGI